MIKFFKDFLTKRRNFYKIKKAIKTKIIRKADNIFSKPWRVVYLIDDFDEKGNDIYFYKDFLIYENCDIDYFIRVNSQKINLFYPQQEKLCKLVEEQFKKNNEINL